MQKLKDGNVNYLIIYPEWYSSLISQYGDYFERVYSAKLDNNTICGEPEMIVYKIHWEKNPDIILLTM